MAPPTISIRPFDPSGETQSWRYTTNGRVQSYKWALDKPVWATTGQYEIVTGEEATHGDSYFSVKCIVPTGYAQNTLENQQFVMTHDFVPVTGNKWYSVTADLIGATLVRPTGSSPAVFRFSCGLTEWDSGFGPAFIGASSTGPGASNSSTIGTTVNSIEAGTAAHSVLLDASTVYVQPFVALTFGDVASIVAGTTIEFRFDNLRLMGPRNTSSLNGTIPSRILYSTSDPAYVATADPYSLMTLATPSIGERIERPCYIEQIRYDVYPGKDKWQVALGLSDAITGSYWALDKSKLDVDTRLGI
jgi:hypothetical protein